MEEVKVQVRFTLSDEDGEYTDALYYTLEEYENLDPVDLEKAKKARHDNWKKARKSEPIEPSEEQQREYLEAQIVQAERELEVLNEEAE